VQGARTRPVCSPPAHHMHVCGQSVAAWVVQPRRQVACSLRNSCECDALHVRRPLCIARQRPASGSNIQYEISVRLPEASRQLVATERPGLQPVMSPAQLPYSTTRPHPCRRRGAGRVRRRAERVDGPELLRAPHARALATLQAPTASATQLQALHSSTWLGARGSELRRQR